MPGITTYSFTDIYLNISHPSVGQITVNGQGTGSISKEMTQERTTHDVAADGTVMISKVAGDNGNLTVSVQQNSPAGDFLLKWWNYVKMPGTPAKDFAAATIEMRSLVTGDRISAKGVSIQKQPGRVYQAQGQQQAWILMCADIQDQ